MIKNESKLDRIIRLILAFIFFVLAFWFSAGLIQIILYVISAIMLITSITGFCLLYKIFGIDTNKN